MDSNRMAAMKFLDAFEAVFHSDWAYTRSQLNIPPRDSLADEKLLRIFGEPAGATSNPDATFLAPDGDREGREAQNWGNYEGLLDAYKTLCAALGRAPVTP